MVRVRVTIELSFSFRSEPCTNKNKKKNNNNTKSFKDRRSNNEALKYRVEIQAFARVKLKNARVDNASSIPARESV